LTISQWIEETFKVNNKIEFTVLNPDIASTLSGTLLTIEEVEYLYRGYKAWVNLAELHHAKMLTPKSLTEHTILLTFVKLNEADSFHKIELEDKREKYGVDSSFFAINKNEEPTFLYAYRRALEAVKIQNRKHILNLGINRGDEFELIERLIGQESFQKIAFSGVDHSASALAYAKERFPTKNLNFYQHDITLLKELKLERADLIISIGTLQSPSINYKPFLMELLQEHLTHDGAFILGFPNSRWIESELIYGAKAPNYPYSEMSLLYNDVIFAKKYLQQKKFRVTITGREYIFLTATRIGLNLNSTKYHNHS